MNNVRFFWNLQYWQPIFPNDEILSFSSIDWRITRLQVEIDLIYLINICKLACVFESFMRVSGSTGCWLRHTSGRSCRSRRHRCRCPMCPYGIHGVVVLYSPIYPGISSLFKNDVTFDDMYQAMKSTPRQIIAILKNIFFLLTKTSPRRFELESSNLVSIKSMIRGWNWSICILIDW